MIAIISMMIVHAFVTPKTLMRLPARQTNPPVAAIFAMLQNAPCQPIQRACSSLESTDIQVPSAAISCVAPLIAITARMAMVIAKKEGRCNAKATNANNNPVSICVSTTKNFFVLYISRNGLHKGLNVHGSMMSDVQKVI